MDSFPLFRIFKTGFINFTRNLRLSATATMVMVITLVIFATLALLFGITEYSVKTTHERVDISVYLKNGLAENRIMSIKEDLETDPRIKQVTYVSAQDALNEFKIKHADDPMIQESLKELTENPLPATLQVKSIKLEDYSQIAESLKQDKYKEFVSKVSYDKDKKIQKTIDNLDRILKFIITGGTGLIIVFSLIAILVIYNTITLTIYNRREEVEIMRLVGATNWYIRGPFIAESIFYSILATIITALLLIPIYNKVLPKIFVWIGSSAPGGAVFSQPYLNYPYLLLSLFLIAFLLTTISSLLAIRKYLRI